MNVLLRGEGEVSQPTAGRTARGVWLIVRGLGGGGGSVYPGDKKSPDTSGNLKCMC